MLLRAGNLNVRVESATDGETRWLAEYLSFDDDKSKFRWGKGRGQPLQMYNHPRQLFPAGLLRLVERDAAAAELTINVLDARTKPCTPDATADLAWLRNYQLEAVRRVVDKTRGILWLPTGAGKTEVAVGLARVLPCRWLFLTHRTTLALQAAERFNLRNHKLPGFVPAGVIADGTWRNAFDHGGNFNVATFQTVQAGLKSGDSKMKALLFDVQGVIPDECHVAAAETFWSTLMALPNAYYRVGLSGTPLARGDRKSIYILGALGDVILRVKPETLIKAGVMAKPTITFARVEHPFTLGGWSEVYNACVVKSTFRNAAVVSAIRSAKKPALVFVSHIEHGEKLQAMLARLGTHAPFITGKESTETRTEAIDAIKSGSTDVMIATVVFQEGVDLPNLRTVIMAAGGKSNISVIQKTGRAVRVTDDKAECDVVDFFDVGIEVLEKHSKARRKAYMAEGYDVVMGDDVG